MVIKQEIFLTVYKTALASYLQMSLIH